MPYNILQKLFLYHPTGIITSLTTLHGIIDNKHYFERNLIRHLEEIKVGDKVSYLASTLGADNIIKIVRILDIVTENWNAATTEACNELIEELQSEKPEYFKTQQMMVFGKVVDRKKNLIYVDSARKNQNVVIDMDNIVSNFIPIVGDRVSMMCRIQVDPSELDFSGSIVEVKSLEPQRSKTLTGVITFTNEHYGIVDEDYLFFPEALPDSFKPAIGMNVCIDAIESEQAKFAWRCLKLIPTETQEIQSGVEASLNDVKQSIIAGLLENKNGIVISEMAKFKFTLLEDTRRQSFFVKNTNRSGSVKIRNFTFNSNKSQSQVRLISPNMRSAVFIKAGEEIQYVIEAYSKFYGCARERVTFNFDKFKIARFIEVEVKDEMNLTPSIGTGPIHRNTDYTRKMWKTKDDYVPGERPVKAPAFIKVRIEDFSIPDYLKAAILENYTITDINESLTRCLPYLEQDLTSKNYVVILDALLHLEEIQLFHIFRKYDKDHATFNHENEFLALHMDNVAESRPSIVIGDSITVHNVWNAENKFKSHQGFVHKVLNNRILLKFNAAFHQNYKGEGYKIEFFFSRAPFRKMHYAVRQGLKSLGPEFLFPSKIQTRETPQLNVEFNENQDLVLNNDKVIPWFNSQLNTVQKCAVKNILRSDAKGMPYVIFGPPGTGKTHTLVEIIIQLVRHVPGCRLIVATPSNSSANLLTQRIADTNQLNRGEFVRIVGINAIQKETIPEEILPYCATVDIALEGTKESSTCETASGLKLNVRKSEIGMHRITIGTCVSLGNLIAMGFPRNHFTHVVIDEAGQCTEPEIMIPAMFLNREEGQLILAGDPMQLGPIILSQHALARGLGTSFLSRILERFPYQRDKQV